MRTWSVSLDPASVVAGDGVDLEGAAGDGDVFVRHVQRLGT